MLTYESLSTEKYWNKSVKQELKAYRKMKNRDAIRNLFLFLFVAGMMLVVLFAVETMPMWLPPVTDFVTNNVERVNSFMQSQSAATATTTVVTGS